MRVLHVGDDFQALRPCGLTAYVDDLLRAQVAAGHEVTYVFSGRHYPRLERPRLKRWTSGGVRMVELIGSTIHAHWEAGTLHPERDLEDRAGEVAFMAAVREARPEIVHVHELARLPSSILEHAKDLGLPVVMTLHDYKPVCAAVRLLDADGRRCTRTDVGEDCARNCAGAPRGRAHLVDWTLRYERRRLKEAVPLAGRLPLGAVAPAVGAVTRALVRSADGPAPVDGTPPTGPEGYQRRRDVNVRRLSRCDRLVAPSPRVAELYQALGVAADRLVVQRLALAHHERLRPAGGPEVGSPLKFVALGAGAHPAKGSRELLAAIGALRRSGHLDHCRIVVAGHVEPEVHAELAAEPAVELVGVYAPAQLDELLGDVDVGLVPSTWDETFGFVGIEMLAKGVPIIGSALGGITTYVREGETGWLNRSTKAEELAALMAAAVDDPASVVELRRSVRARRDELVPPYATHVAEVEALYAEVVATRASTTASPSTSRPSGWAHDDSVPP